MVISFLQPFEKPGDSEENPEIDGRRTAVYQIMGVKGPKTHYDETMVTLSNVFQYFVPLQSSCLYWIIRLKHV